MENTSGFELLTEQERNLLCEELAPQIDISGMMRVAALLSHLNAIAQTRGLDDLEVETMQIKRQLFIEEPNAIGFSLEKLEKTTIRDLRKTLGEPQAQNV